MTEDQSLTPFWMTKDHEQFIKEAKLAAVFHIAPNKAEMISPDDTYLEYPILAGPQVLHQQELLVVKQLLSDTSTYILDEAFKMCLFTPNIGLRLEDDNGDFLDFLICFDCNVLKIMDQGQEVFSEDFDPGRDELLMLFYPLFKEMPYFQALSSRLSKE